ALGWWVATGAGVGALWLGRPRTASVLPAGPVFPVALELSADMLTDALRAAGLVKADATPQLVTPPWRDGNGWAVTLDLPRGGGKTAADVIAKRDTLAAELGVDEIQVIMTRVRAAAGGHAGRLSVWVADDDPYLGAPTPSPLTSVEQFSVWEPIPFGQDARGRRILLYLMWQSMFFGGLPRRGKTFAQRLPSAAGVLDAFVRHYVADGKGGADWRPMRAVAHRLVIGAEDEAIQQFLAMLDELITEMGRRFAVLGTLPTSVCPEGKLTPEISRRYGMPVIFITIDELQEYLSAMAGPVKEETVVKVSGRTPVLTPAVVATARQLIDDGWSQGQVADRLRVSASALSKALRRHPVPARPAQTELEVVRPDQAPSERGCPDGARDAASTPGAGTVDDLTSPVDDTTAEEDADITEDIVDDTADRADQGAPQGETVPAASATAPQITHGVFPTRYAGAMLAYAYLDRIGACVVLSVLPQTPWRRFDQAQITCHTLLALLLGVGSIEQVKTLPRAQAGPLTGTPVSPELHTLRPRLTAIADQTDVLALQPTLAAAMLALAGESAGIFYVDDHFVPYSGAKPVAMGHNGKRDRCEKGRVDTLITNARGLAVCFTTGDPSHDPGGQISRHAA
ncbi:MAG: hypothetical protein WCF33_14530, partial [Pseudonocardiaceae bacterium]